MCPKIPLIDDLTDNQIPPGSNVLVEFDSASQWFNASIAIAAGWIKTGGKLHYGASAQPPERIRTILGRLGVDVAQAESKEKLTILDWYTATLGRKSREKHAVASLRVSELSISMRKQDEEASVRSDTLWVIDSASTVARFNDERSWVEFTLTRAIPSTRTDKSRSIDGLLRGVHTEGAYRQLEAAYDGIVDFRIEEKGIATRNLVRIRTMRDVGYDREWHEVNIGVNFEVTLE